MTQNGLKRILNRSFKKLNFGILEAPAPRLGRSPALQAAEDLKQGAAPRLLFLAFLSQPGILNRSFHSIAQSYRMGRAGAEDQGVGGERRQVQAADRNWRVTIDSENQMCVEKKTLS